MKIMICLTAELEKLKQENLVLSECIPMHKQQFQQLEDEKKEIIGKLGRPLRLVDIYTF